MRPGSITGAHAGAGGTAGAGYAQALQVRCQKVKALRMGKTRRNGPAFIVRLPTSQFCSLQAVVKHGMPNRYQVWRPFDFL
jgi:hypothetical protein